jgi:hypothetical protein
LFESYIFAFEKSFCKVINCISKKKVAPFSEFPFDFHKSLLACYKFISGKLTALLKPAQNLSDDFLLILKLNQKLNGAGKN